MTPSSDEASSEDEVNTTQHHAETTTLTANMVKFMLNYAATKIPIKRADIAKMLNINTKLFAEVFRNCLQILKSIYGLEVREITESKSAKMYMIHSSLFGVTALQFPADARQDITLLFIVLSYIFMKGGEVQERN
jgi:hypothetical protein